MFVYWKQFTKIVREIKAPFSKLQTSFIIIFCLLLFFLLSVCINNLVHVHEQIHQEDNSVHFAFEKIDNSIGSLALTVLLSFFQSLLISLKVGGTNTKKVSAKKMQVRKWTLNSFRRIFMSALETEQEKVNAIFSITF